MLKIASAAAMIAGLGAISIWAAMTPVGETPSGTVDELRTGSIEMPETKVVRKQHTAPAPPRKKVVLKSDAVPAQQISAVAAMCTTELGKRNMISKNGYVPQDVCTCVAEGLARDLRWPDYYYAGILLNHGLRNTKTSAKQQKPELVKIFKAARKKGISRKRFETAFQSVGKQIRICS